jgi:hypothetical protein
MNLSPKTIRPEPIYSFRPHQSPQLQKAGYPPSWSQWSKMEEKKGWLQMPVMWQRRK